MFVNDEKNKEKLRELNEKYMGVRRQSIILLVVIVSLFIISLVFIPKGVDNIALFVIGILCFIQAYSIRKHSDYYYERAKLIPKWPSPSTSSQFYTSIGVFFFVMGAYFLIIEVFIPNVISDERWLDTYSFLIMLFISYVITGFIYKKYFAPRRRVGEAKEPAQERKDGESREA